MPKIIIIVGSKSDLEVLKESQMIDALEKLHIFREDIVISVISAHRNLAELEVNCVKHVKQGTKIFIAAASMSAHLPGVIAAITKCSLPVLTVALGKTDFHLNAALMSMIDMPKGVPVAVCGVNESGLYNAAVLAAQILALEDTKIRDAFSNFYLFEVSKPPQINIKLEEN
jgi:5-(carboxyamino)imidazole ribonucleotide mutase